MKFILAKKIEMTQKFTPEGVVIPVTIITAGPCKVLRLKNKENDGYQAVTLGYVAKKKVSKAVAGQTKDLGTFRYISEFRLDKKEKNPKMPELKVGDEITADAFTVGDELTLTGFSKGKGFQGVVKRHHFAGGPASHGHKDNLRMPGSIGSGGVQKVFKGLRMPGRMGNERISINGLKVLEVNPENNTIVVSGSVPGARNGLLLLSAKGELKIKQAAVSDSEVGVEQPAVEIPAVEEEKN